LSGSGRMGRGAAAIHASLPQHTTLRHAGDPKVSDARPRDAGSGTPDIPFPPPSHWYMNMWGSDRNHGQSS